MDHSKGASPGPIDRLSVAEVNKATTVVAL